MQNMDWYHNLVKPELNPPDAWFGIVWPILYLMMAVALLVILFKSSGRQRVVAAVLFLVQLGLNLSWSPTFFGAQNISGALLVLTALWLVLLVTVIVFFKLNKAAGWLMIPYWLWTSFAFYLNFEIWRLNV